MRLIDADALKEYFEKCLRVDSGKDDTKERYAYMAWLRGVHAIDNAPTVDAVSKDLFEQYKWERDTALETLEEHGLSLGQKKRHGKWIPHPAEREWDVCTNCATGCKRREYEDNGYGIEVTEFNYPYCPNCGAKMQGEE